MSAIFVKIFDSFGDVADINTTLFPVSSSCGDLPSAYSGFYTSNLGIYEDYLIDQNSSPFFRDGK
jgi:hypothetical protein